MHPIADLQLLVLLIFANGTPVIAKWILGRRWQWPLDHGLRLGDGRPLLGASKTARGLVLSVLVTSAGAPVLGLSWRIGALVAAAAMAGDLLSSFTKRRLGRPSSSRALGLDQIPESLLPALACIGALGLSPWDVALVVAVFFAGEILLSRVLYRAHVRDEPY